MIFDFAKISREKKQTYHSNTLFPVLKHDELLSRSKREVLIHKLLEIPALDFEFKELLYHQVIQHFAEFVQLLPNEPHGKLGMLLDDGLLRGYLAAQICHEERETALFSYAAFTAALLQDVGKVYQQKLIISDHDGAFVREWYPAINAVVDLGDYYKIRFLNKRWTNLIHYVTPMLADQLLPKLGLKWLSSEYQIFEMWLAVLVGDSATGRALKHILQLVDERLDDLRNEFDFEPVDANTKEPEATIQGEAFVDWVIDGLADESIPVNTEDALIQVTEQQVLLEYPAVFKLFSDAYPRYRDWTVVYQQYNMLGLAKLSGYDYKFEQFFSRLPGTDDRLNTITSKHFLARKRGEKTAARKMVVVANKDVLFAKATMPSSEKKHGFVTKQNANQVLSNLNQRLQQKNTYSFSKK